MSEDKAADHILLPDGTMTDAPLYAEMLADPEANLYADMSAFRQAVASGVDPELAMRSFGITDAILAVFPAEPKSEEQIDGFPSEQTNEQTKVQTDEQTD
jgi:hypothetical protein